MAKKECTCGYSIGHPLVPKCTCKPTEWVSLTDKEIFGIFGTYIGDPDYNHNKLLLDARRIEAKLKEKNSG